MFMEETTKEQDSPAYARAMEGSRRSAGSSLSSPMEAGGLDFDYANIERGFLVRSFEKLEKALTGFANRLDKHAEDINALKSVVYSKSVNKEIAELKSAMESQLKSLSHRMGAVEEATAVPFDPNRGRLTIGELVSTHDAILRRYTEKEGDLTTKADLEGLQRRMMLGLDQRLEAALEAKTANSEFNALERAVRELHSAHSALEGVVSCKMDKTDLARFDTTMDRLRRFDAERDDIAARIEALSRRIDGQEHSLGQQIEASSKLSSLLGKTNASLKSKAESATVSNLADRLSDVISLSAQRSEAEARRVEELLNSKQGLAKQLRDLESRFGSTWDSIEGRLERLDSDLQRKADSDQVPSMAKWEDQAELIRRLQEDVDMRVKVHFFNESEQKLEELRAACVDLEGRVNIALKFIDWYSRKGAAFEANAASVERHLNAIARSSVGPVKPPLAKGPAVDAFQRRDIQHGRVQHPAPPFLSGPEAAAVLGEVGLDHNPVSESSMPRGGGAAKGGTGFFFGADVSSRR